MPSTRLVLTDHAREMLVERAIDLVWVEATIREPEIIEDDPIRLGVVRAFRRIPEREGRFLRVVYIRTDDTVRVLTVFFDRSRRR